MYNKDNYYANKGVERNKKPLKNIVYRVGISQLKPDVDKEKYKQFKFKDIGYIFLESYYQEKNPITRWHGFIKPEDLYNLLGDKQWAKFCQGKREFIMQRRINGRNIQKITEENKIYYADRGVSESNK